MKTENKTPDNQKEREFPQRLDYYLQFTAVYTLALVVYALIIGTIREGKLVLVLKDPIVLLLASFSVVSVVSLAVNFYKKRSIIVGNNFIILKSRFRQRKYEMQEIVRISYLHRRIQNNRRQSYRQFKIKVLSRKRMIKIRPSLFIDEFVLAEKLNSLRQRLHR